MDLKEWEWSRPTVKILVGEEEKIFYVHADALICQSPVWQRRLTGPWKDNSPDMDWKEFDDATIKCVMSYLYTGSYNIWPSKAAKPESDEFAPGRLLVAHAKVYCFAYQFDCESLKAFALGCLEGVLDLAEPSSNELLSGLSIALVLIYSKTNVSKSNLETTPKSLGIGFTEALDSEESMLEDSTIEFAQLFDTGETTNHEPARTLLMAYFSRHLEHLKDADPKLLEVPDIVTDLIQAMLHRAVTLERACKKLMKQVPGKKTKEYKSMLSLISD